jgi:2-polyprenyl-6-methoxyphenol hydroxylase-like FAD-dependent oxidoreductase
VNEADVVVVGGRVAGASTALLLARAGLRVTLLDRAPRGTDTLSTHGLMRAGVLQLARWGLLGAVVAAGTPPIRRTTFHYDDGESAQVSIRPGAGVDALYAPRRQVLDRILLDAAEDDGVDVRPETRVVGVRTDRSGRVTGVGAVDKAGRTFPVPARFTVGADGLRSTVAQAVGAPVVRRGRSAGAVLYRYLADIPDDGYRWAYLDRAAAGLIPTNAGETCVFVATGPRRMRELRRSGTEAAFDALLRSSPGGEPLAERVRAATPAGRLHGFAGEVGFVRRSWGPGWALVGDAGYFKDPITTHGMTDALRDAELLAGALVDVLADGAPEATTLASYQATRDRLSRALFEVTDHVAAYDWDPDQARGLLRQVSSAMSDEVDHLRSLPDRFAPQRPAARGDDMALLAR